MDSFWTKSTNLCRIMEKPKRSPCGKFRSIIPDGVRLVQLSEDQITKYSEILFPTGPIKIGADASAYQPDVYPEKYSFPEYDPVSRWAVGSGSAPPVPNHQAWFDTFSDTSAPSGKSNVAPSSCNALPEKRESVKSNYSSRMLKSSSKMVRPKVVKAVRRSVAPAKRPDPAVAREKFCEQARLIQSILHEAYGPATTMKRKREDSEEISQKKIKI